MLSRPQKNINLLIQSIFRFGKAKHSHVAITLGEFSLIHAMPKAGVRMQSLGEYLRENRNFIVYRHKLASLEKSAHFLREHLQFHHLQKYGIFNVIFTNWRHSFCSELAAKAYKKANLKLTRYNIYPKWVFPIDIFRHVSVDSDWVDVTEKYIDFFLKDEYFKIQKMASSFEQFNVEYTQKMGFEQQNLLDLINRSNNRNDEKEGITKPPMNFWSNRLATQSRLLFTISHWKTNIAESIEILWKYVRKKL